jgi:phosphopantothenoylcysteine decarboxylase/phosphopantothenate--cysteine ligase
MIQITTADEMLVEVKKYWSDCTIGVFSAAVADYKPLVVEEQKIKKKEEEIILKLVKNPDILKWAGETKSTNQFLVGFALETNDAFENALRKIENKNLDLIVLNSLENKGAGFGHDTNKISLITKQKKVVDFPLKTKKELAKDIIQFISDTIDSN